MEVGVKEGIKDGVMEGNRVGLKVLGRIDGTFVDGRMVGGRLGALDTGDFVGEDENAGEGMEDAIDGTAVGSGSVGIADGEILGVEEGDEDGRIVGGVVR